MTTEGRGAARAERALLTLGVLEDHLEQAIKMLDVDDDRSLDYAKAEAQAMKDDMPWLFQGGTSHERQPGASSVAKGRDEAARRGWTPEKDERKTAATSLQARGRAEAVARGWTKP